ncbi:TPA: helix-turn-helix domain-containing protein [Salmonella enterica subsp. enterica serovar Typhi str. AG3]|nr:helix-turn-helix domain-containing protein [Salmonella enterica subsp. enterica serovar Typhi str. AG3]
MARPKHSPEDIKQMEIVKKNLRRISKEKKISQKKISDITNISTSTMSDYFNANSLIPPGNLYLIAEALGVTTEDIYFEKQESFIPLGLYGEIYCGDGEVHYGYPITTIETPKEWISGGEYFYLEAKGDSMIGAKVHEGDLLLIRKQETVDNGEIAAVIVDDKRMLKRVYKTENKFMLISENPNYSPIEYTPETDENIRIIGKLKKSITNY